MITHMGVINLIRVKQHNALLEGFNQALREVELNNEGHF
jgi:hypothetical protein